MADEISQKLIDIQSQLAKLQTDYTSMATAMYDMFFNTEAKDVTLRLYNDNGELVDVIFFYFLVHFVRSTTSV